MQALQPSIIIRIVGPTIILTLLTSCVNHPEVLARLEAQRLNHPEVLARLEAQRLNEQAAVQTSEAINTSSSDGESQPLPHLAFLRVSYIYGVKVTSLDGVKCLVDNGYLKLSPGTHSMQCEGQTRLNQFETPGRLSNGILREMLVTTFYEKWFATISFEAKAGCNYWIDPCLGEGGRSWTPRVRDQSDPSTAPADTDATRILDAAKSGDSKKVGELLKSNLDLVFVTDTDGWTPLHIAAYAGNKEVVALLVANKANANAKDNDGETPLHLAVYLDHADVAELLLANGANVNAKDNNDQTPLHVAAIKGFKDVAELLIVNKADVNAKEKAAKTPLRLATNSGHKDVVELLRQHDGHK